jgi:phytoene dehydrogenase-like protein
VRIAVVGSGISGLAAAWLLSRRHDVHVFEGQPRIGGHTDTRMVPSPTGAVVPIDTGFIVYNEATYPLLVRLFDELEVATQPSSMSWSLTCAACDLEYAGNARGLFAQPRRLADPRHLRMVRDLVAFNRLGRQLRGPQRRQRRLQPRGVGDGQRRGGRRPARQATQRGGRASPRRAGLGQVGRPGARIGDGRRVGRVPASATAAGQQVTQFAAFQPARPQLSSG